MTHLVAEVLQGAPSAVEHNGFAEIRELPLGLGVDSYQVEVLPTHLHKAIEVPTRGGRPSSSYRNGKHCMHAMTMHTMSCANRTFGFCTLVRITASVSSVIRIFPKVTASESCREKALKGTLPIGACLGTHHSRKAQMGQ